MTLDSFYKNMGRNRFYIFTTHSGLRPILFHKAVHSLLLANIMNCPFINSLLLTRKAVSHLYLLDMMTWINLVSILIVSRARVNSVVNAQLTFDLHF